MAFRLLRYVAVLVLGVLVTFAGPGAIAQADAFAFEAVASRASDTTESQVTVRLEIPYSSLRFVRRTAGFASEHAIEVTFHHANGNQEAGRQVLSRSFPRQVEVTTFDESRSFSSIARFEQRLALQPGAYVARVRVVDQNGGRPLVQEHLVEIPVLGRGVSMSDVTLLDGQTQQPRVFAAVPADVSELLIQYDLYATAQTPIRIRYGVRTAPAERRARGLFGFFGRRVQEEAGPLTTLALEQHELAAGTETRTTTLSFPELEPGDYQFVVRLESSRGAVLEETIRSFAVQWYGLPSPFFDLDTAIAQLRYVARDREIRAMQEAPTYQERLRLFTEFWDRRDPTPGTRRNERMEEYYSRVAYANSSFGVGNLIGWSSDQGEVYIRYGDPDTVENHGVENVSRPYEVWNYERIGRRFIFVQDERSGNLRLMVPIWDERTRM